MAAKISNWLGTRSQRSHLSTALLPTVKRYYCLFFNKISNILRIQREFQQILEKLRVHNQGYRKMGMVGTCSQPI